MSSDDVNNNSNDGNKTRLRIKIKRWHGVAKWTWGVGDDEDDVCIVCQSAFEGVAPGVKFPGDECPVVVSLMFFVGSSFCENVDSESELLTLTIHEILDVVGEYPDLSHMPAGMGIWGGKSGG
ncbi:hypothetical protein ACHAXA_000036 [Cyclostephanos tholiformis]|uniref:Anaphase-promoting complex subunit 11 RING-H2 finger domain-containing protein n=1 Tax=Cyclostephanos tholiformis TaxID=382380 RepID=A0ABD3SRV9_9STRA